MAIEIKAPTFPESVADGTVATWHKQPGEAVKRDELIVDIETDKVVLEVLATADGVLGDIVKGEGDTVLSDEVLGSIVEGGAAAAPDATGPPRVAGGRRCGGPPCACRRTRPALSCPGGRWASRRAWPASTRRC